MTTEKIEAQVTDIMTELSAKDVEALFEVARSLNGRDYPCPYLGNFWSARKIVRAIVERTEEALSSARRR